MRIIASRRPLPVGEPHSEMATAAENGFHENGHDHGVRIAGDETADEIKKNDRLALLQTRFPHRTCDEAIYRGLLLNKTSSPQGVDLVRRGSLRPQDCLVCGFPKSGTTWLEEVVYLILTKGDFKTANSLPCYIRVPLWEDAQMDDVISNMASPRVLKTHLPYDSLPVNCAETNKIVWILRNPKDVAVSFYYFYQSCATLGHYSGTWKEYLEMFMEGYVACADWFTYALSWFPQRHRPNVLMVTYEHMKAQPEATARDIWRFLHGPTDAIDDATLAAIVEHTSFQAMKQNPKTNFANIDAIRLPFMRKGQVGDWKNHFTVAQNDAFEELMRQRITDPELLQLIQKNAER